MIRKFLLASALGWAFCAQAADGVSLELGRGDESSDLVRGAVQWSWGKKRPVGPHLQWGGYWELSAGFWKNGETVADIGITPVFRLERSSGSVVPYVEGAIGLHLESQVEFSEHRTTGTKFQFGDHIGAGMRFGGHLRHDVGLRLQHLSNGGVAKPNPGINFGIVRYQYHFE
jgi:lipid A 3-O-deacylase